MSHNLHAAADVARFATAHSATVERHGAGQAMIATRVGGIPELVEEKPATWSREAMRLRWRGAWSNRWKIRF